MLKLHFVLLILLSQTITSTSFATESKNTAGVTHKKTIKYRKHSEVDLTGSSVEGKPHTPNVFYIFQRKRSGGHDTVALPEDFPEHHELTVSAIRKALPK